MFQEISVWAFDLLKKHNMEKYYLQGRVWGRKDSNEDIAKAVNLISDRHYERCLDVGAGLGHYTETVTGLCDTVVAIDISKKAIEQAQARLSHLTNVQFEVKNLRDAGSNWGTFDLVILAEVLYYLGDERFPVEFGKLIQRIADLVKEKSRVLLVNYVSPVRSLEELEAYADAFIKTGLVLEKKQIFTIGEKTFLIEVLRK